MTNSRSGGEVDILSKVAPWMYFGRSLKRTLQQLAEIIPVSHVLMVVTHDPLHNVIRFSSDIKPNVKSHRIRLSHVSRLRIMQSAHPVVIPNTMAEDEAKELLESGIGAYMGFPVILSDGMMYGMLCTFDPDPVVFEDTQVNAMELTAKLIGHILDMERKSLHDPLTGALNRLFLELYDQSPNHEFGSNFAIVYVDLDGFKEINDRYGHETGDHVLRLMVQRLRRRIRMDDAVIRLGGDEFVVILSDMSNDLDIVESAVDRLQQSLDVEYSVDGQAIHVSASLGVSMYPFDGDHFETLLRVADSSMYESKRLGGNSFTIHSESPTRRQNEIPRSSGHVVVNSEFGMHVV